jgi:hypothetical protein
MPKRKKPTKALEKCAREIKDSDEFVGHVGNIADRYRREQALDAGSRHNAVRRSLREFQKHAIIITEWLRQAHKTNGATAEQDALNQIGSALYGVPSLAHAEGKNISSWLSQAEQAAARCLADAKLLSRKASANAPRIAAEALRATFAHHKLKWSATITKQKQSDAVRVLCAIAKSAGDTVLTPDVARLALREANSKLL